MGDMPSKNYDNQVKQQISSFKQPTRKKAGSSQTHHKQNGKFFNKSCQQ
jgi:hypothetical protein